MDNRIKEIFKSYKTDVVYCVGKDLFTNKTHAENHAKGIKPRGDIKEFKRSQFEAKPKKTATKKRTTKKVEDGKK